MRAAIAFIVVALAVEHLRTKLSIHRRQTVIGEHVSDHARHDFRNRGTARNTDDRFVFDHVSDRDRLSRIRFGRVDAAPGRAGAPSDNGFSAFSDMEEFFEEGFAAGQTEHAVFAKAGRTFNSKDVVAVELFHHIFKGLMVLFTGGSHQGVVVSKRNHRKDDVFCQRMVRTDEGFGTASAFEAMKPDHRCSGFSFHRMSDVRCAVGSEPEGSGCQRAEFKETASRDSLPPHQLIISFCHRSIFSLVAGAALSRQGLDTHV